LIVCHDRSNAKDFLSLGQARNHEQQQKEQNYLDTDFILDLFLGLGGRTSEFCRWK
jgi:hypothetical protein